MQQLRRRVQVSARLVEARALRGSDRSVVLFGERQLAKVGQQTVQPLKGYRERCRDLHADGLSVRRVIDHEHHVAPCEAPRGL